MGIRYLYDTILIENLKKIKDGNKRNFHMIFHLKDGLRVEFTGESEMMKEGALLAFDYVR